MTISPRLPFGFVRRTFIQSATGEVIEGSGYIATESVRIQMGADKSLA